MTEKGTGYLQQGFSVPCQYDACQYDITKEKLAVFKLVEDIIRNDGTYRSYIAYVPCSTHPGVLANISLLLPGLKRDLPHSRGRSRHGTWSDGQRQHNEVLAIQASCEEVLGCDRPGVGALHHGEGQLFASDLGSNYGFTDEGPWWEIVSPGTRHI